MFEKGYKPWNKGLKNWREPIKFTLKTRKQMSKSAKARGPNFLGKHHSDITKQKLREARLRQPDPALGHKVSKKLREYYRKIHAGKRYSPQTEFKKGQGQISTKPFVKGQMAVNPFPKGHRPWNKGKPHLAVRGVNHHNWKNGITEVNQAIRHSLKYINWRRKVFKRDDYTCQNQDCGQRGGRLNADHIQPFSLYPKLRFVIKNGRTLCQKCHKKIGWRYHKTKQ